MKLLGSDHCIALPRGAPTEGLAVTALSVGELTHGAALVTHNTRYLARIPGLVGGDWLET